MTLFKQIAIVVTLLLLLLAGIIMLNEFNRSAQFLQGQLQTTAQDMVTMLGIAISNQPGDVDPATLEVLFNSVFDSGYYTKIELVGVDGNIIHQKSQDIIIENIPGWFINLVPLSPSSGSTQVMKGWTQLGQLSIQLHPGYVYSGLYASFLSTLQWLVVIILGSIAVLWLMLHFLLLPLQRVKQQADSIHNNEFVQQKRLPRTLELKTVVEAMNRMVAKVQSIFQEQEKSLARYQHMLYHDNQSGLGNRRYMLDHLQQSLAEESSFHGCLGIVKLVNFESIRERLDYALTDELVKNVAGLVSQPFQGGAADKIARLNDDEFAFLYAADEDTVVDFIETVYEQFKNLPLIQTLATDVFLVAGISTLESDKKMGDLLSDVDYCLNQAISEGPYSTEKKISSNLFLPQGKMQWRHWFEGVLDNDQLFLVGQLALDANKKAVQKELFIRVKNKQGQVIPASCFMPMASSLGMSIEIDKAVFRLINNNAQIDRKIPLAINLSAAFFELADARNEFEKLLIESAERGIQLCIEASHHILQQHEEMCRQVSEQVKQSGHQFGIDNLDLGQSLKVLQTTRFDYVKLNVNSLSQLSTEELLASYQALKTITDTLDIRIIVVGVDSQALFEQFLALGIQVMQGNLLGEPESI